MVNWKGKRRGKRPFKSPYARSRALNKTALDRQKIEDEEQLPNKLTIRNQWSKPRSKFGINVRFAKATSARVKPRLDFEDSGKAKAGQVVERNFIDAYSEALRTRK